ncbi:hypothetical protein HDU76_004803 [Blyttiomyces sp. JEL0837]|nr:hypothetical protein HDU76_004803 [Blyttiomyces sp. JEL0837]
MSASSSSTSPTTTTIPSRPIPPPLTPEGITHFSTTELAKLSELSENEWNARLAHIRGKTNNSAPTSRELAQKLQRLGVDISEEHFFTSAIATAKFLQSQKPNGGTCYVIGEPGLTYALYEAGFTMNSDNPDYVVIGEGNSHNFEKITKACNLVLKGAKLIGTNPDVMGNADSGIVPACGAFLATIELATGKKAFTCGKPTSLMMRYAQSILGTTKGETCIIGDRMDTDILAGTYAQIDPVLVMSGVTTLNNLYDDAYRPYLVLNGVGEIPTPEVVGGTTSGSGHATTKHKENVEKDVVGESHSDPDMSIELDETSMSTPPLTREPFDTLDRNKVTLGCTGHQRQQSAHKSISTPASTIGSLERNAMGAFLRNGEEKGQPVHQIMSTPPSTIGSLERNDIARFLGIGAKLQGEEKSREGDFDGNVDSDSLTHSERDGLNRSLSKIWKVGGVGEDFNYGGRNGDGGNAHGGEVDIGFTNTRKVEDDVPRRSDSYCDMGNDVLVKGNDNNDISLEQVAIMKSLVEVPDLETGRLDGGNETILPLPNLFIENETANDNIGTLEEVSSNSNSGINLAIDREVVIKPLSENRERMVRSRTVTGMTISHDSDDLDSDVGYAERGIGSDGIDRWGGERNDEHSGDISSRVDRDYDWPPLPRGRDVDLDQYLYMNQQGIAVTSVHSRRQQQIQEKGQRQRQESDNSTINSLSNWERDAMAKFLERRREWRFQDGGDGDSRESGRVVRGRSLVRYEGGRRGLFVSVDDDGNGDGDVGGDDGDVGVEDNQTSSTGGDEVVTHKVKGKVAEQFDLVDMEIPVPLSFNISNLESEASSLSGSTSDVAHTPSSLITTTAPPLTPTITLLSSPSAAITIGSNKANAKDDSREDSHDKSIRATRPPFRFSLSLNRDGKPSGADGDMEIGGGFTGKNTDGVMGKRSFWKVFKCSGSSNSSKLGGGVMGRV